MSDIIKLLPDAVVNQIAAGEVIQRPASVVKELLDNAVDSGASEIKLLVQEAGKSLITVTDNGCGMSATDARMAFERHATSKIQKAEDLFAIQTLGFRGEALASIAAVSEVELKTRRAMDNSGTRISIADSRVRKIEPCACLPGTQIQVQHLFYSVPARKKFLKSDAVEQRHIHDEWVAQAIAHPEIAWSYTQGSNEIYKLAVSGLKQRIAGIFGKKYLEELIPLEQDTEVVKITGFIGTSQLIRRSRGEQLLYVNRRLIKSHYLNHAITSAYEEIMAPGSYPFYVLFLEIDAAKIDINVHPTKHEIKFDDERLIYNFLKVSVKHALGRNSLSPLIDFDNANPGLDKAFQAGSTTTPVSTSDSGHKVHWKDLAFPQADRSQIERREAEIFNANPLEQDHSLFKENPTDFSCYQFYKAFIFVPSKSGLYFIDQQAAHERILYESYRQLMKTDGGSSQKLLFPQTLHMNSSEAEWMRTLMPSLNAVGFEIEDFGSNSFIVHAIPALLYGKFSETELIKQTLDAYREHQEFQLSPVENAARSLAKTSAIKKGAVLSTEEMSLLVEQLFLCEQAHLSPNGRKTTYQIKMNDFLKNFYAI